MELNGQFLSAITVSVFLKQGLVIFGEKTFFKSLILEKKISALKNGA